MPKWKTPPASALPSQSWAVVCMDGVLLLGMAWPAAGFRV